MILIFEAQLLRARTTSSFSSPCLGVTKFKTYIQILGPKSPAQSNEPGLNQKKVDHRLPLLTLSNFCSRWGFRNGNFPLIYVMKINEPGLNQKRVDHHLPPLTSATSNVKWKTSNFIVDFDVEKREDFGVLLSESINFDYLRPYAKF